MTLSNPPSCYESYPPPVDSGNGRNDTGASRDTPIVVDGRSDTSAGCGLPEGCTDGGASKPCPSTPPAEGGACVGQASCFYDVCPSSGRTQATCTAGKWAVTTGSCGPVTCQGTYAGTTPCPSGQVCLAKVGGAALVSCIANPCGTGPASVDCSTETVGCTPMFSIASGVTYYCNTCPAGQLCP